MKQHEPCHPIKSIQNKSLKKIADFDWCTANSNARRLPSEQHGNLAASIPAGSELKMAVRLNTDGHFRHE